MIWVFKSEYNNRSEISAPTWNDTFDLTVGSYSTSDIEDYFEFIIKKHKTLSENPPVQNIWTGLKTTLFSK